MTATDELRRLLDERGVEWTEVDKHTVWWGESPHHQASAYSSILFGESERVHLSAMVTPDQAIEATLGSDLKAENEKLREQIETLVMYVEADGTRYWVDDDGNQHFDHSAVKDDADELRQLVLDYEELAAKLCDARECDGCPFDSERTICEHMRLIARVGELGVDE